MSVLKATPRLSPAFPRQIHRTVPDPRAMEWQDWVDSMVGMNGRLGLPNLVNVNDDWREFADRLALHVPDTPYQGDFDDWRDWVYALRASLLL
jgi:hypothetical protein